MAKLSKTRPTRTTLRPPLIGIDALLSSLPRLPPEDLQQIKLRVDGLLAVSQPGSMNGDEVNCYQEYVEMIRRRGGRAAPLYAIKKTAHYKSSGFVNGAAVVGQFVDDNFGRMRPAARVRVVHLLSQCCASYVGGDKNSLRGFATALKHVADAVDAAFPGYADANLLKRLVRTR